MLALASALLIAAAAPPEPVILAGPAEGSSHTKSSATFVFLVSRQGYDFECKVGSRLEHFEPCTSPYTATGLRPGAHVFQVRARTADEIGPAATRGWTITAIDDDGDGHTVEADCADTEPQIHPGAPDLPFNGIDEDCSGSDYAPVLIPQLPFPASPTPVPAPAPASAPPAQGKIAISLSYFMVARKRATTFSTLSVKDVPKGATVKVTCTGGCPRKAQTLAKSGTVALTGYRGKALKVGTKLTVAVTKPGMLGMAKVITIRSNRRPSITTRTLT